MAIVAGLNALQTQINSTQNLGISGTPEVTSLQIAMAISSIVPSGVIMIGPVATPLVPAGLSATQIMLESSFKSGIGGIPSISSQQMATAISVLVPIVPPTGLSVLQIMLQNIFNDGISGTSSLTSLQMANAIINYFLAGAVI